jgi:hypothetical protein
LIADQREAECSRRDVGFFSALPPFPLPSQVLRERPGAVKGARFVREPSEPLTARTVLQCSRRGKGGGGLRGYPPGGDPGQRPEHLTARAFCARYQINSPTFPPLPTTDRREANHAGPSQLPSPTRHASIRTLCGALGSGASWCPQFHNGAAISVSNSCPVAGPLSSAATSQSPELGDLLIQPIAFFLRRRWPGLAVAKRLVHLSTHP